MSDLQTLLAAIEARAEAATPGPWDAYFETGLSPMIVTFTEDAKGMRKLKDAVMCVGHHTNWNDLEFAAEARTDIPRLLAMLRKCREQRELLRTWYVDELTHMRPIERHTKLDEDNKYDDAELAAILEGGE